MTIVWINGLHKEDLRVFDSVFETEEWADALYQDFAVEMSAGNNVGYQTPDKKVVDFLGAHLSKWAAVLGLQFDVHTGVSNQGVQRYYQVLATPQK